MSISWHLYNLLGLWVKFKVVAKFAIMVISKQEGPLKTFELLSLIDTTGSDFVSEGVSHLHDTEKY